MTDTAHHKAGANSEGKLSPSSLIGDIRGGGRVLKLRTTSGQFYVRANPRGATGGEREFTVVHYGTGGGFVSHHPATESTVKGYIGRRDGERAIRIDSATTLWPDGFDAVPGDDS